MPCSKTIQCDIYGYVVGIAQALPAIRSASRATRSGSAVVLFVLCGMVCVLQDVSVFKTMTKIAPWCQDQLECLLRYNERPRFAPICTNFWRHTGVRLRHERS